MDFLNHKVSFIQYELYQDTDSINLDMIMTSLSWKS